MFGEGSYISDRGNRMERYAKKTGYFFVILGIAGIIVQLTLSDRYFAWLIVSVGILVYGLSLIRRNSGIPQIQLDLQNSGEPIQEFQYVKVVGMPHAKDKHALKEARIGDVVKFVHEFYNESNPKAIIVNDAIRRKLGYLERGSDIESLMVRTLQEGKKVLATIDSGTKEEVSIHIRFYS